MTLRFRTIARIALQLVVLALITGAFFIRAPHVLGLSMEPRIHSGEYILINTLAYRFGPVQRGDIVAFTHDSPTPKTYLKRVIGLPGDRVSIDRGNVSIDGRQLGEAYVRFRDERSSPIVSVPPDELYVLGDNRQNSDDSRSWGMLPMHDVIGAAMVSLWPLHTLSAL